MMDVKVGDTVIWRARNLGSPQEVTVTRIARKYFYAVIHGQETGFSLETGEGRGEWDGWVRTPAQEDMARRGREAQETLKAHGVVLDSMSAYRLAPEHLIALAEVAKTFPKR